MSERDALATQGKASVVVNRIQMAVSLIFESGDRRSKQYAELRRLRNSDAQGSEMGEVLDGRSLKRERRGGGR